MSMSESPTTPDLGALDGPPEPPPLVVERGLQRGRLSVAFRLLLVLPQVIALYALSLVASIVLLISWFAALFLGRLPEPLARYLCHFIRYSTRVTAYCMFLTDVYPPFRFVAEDYPVRVVLAPGRLNRLAVLFRVFLMIPAAILLGLTLVGWSLAAFFIWLLVLVLGRTPGALFDATTALVRYNMRYSAYYSLVSSAYPWGLFGDRPAPAPAAWPAAAALPPEPAAAPGEPAAAPEEPAPTPAETAPAGLVAAAAGGPAGEQEPPSAARGLLALSSGARQLVILFLVLGVAQYVAGGIVGAITASHAPSAVETLQSLTAAHDSLVGKGQRFQQDVGACASAPEGQQLTCVQTADRDLAVAFEAFAEDVAALEFPASAEAQAVEVERLGHQFAGAMRQLVAAPSPEEYTRLAAGTDQIGSSFDQRYQALVNSLAA